MLRDRSCRAATATRAARSRREFCAAHPRSFARRGCADWYIARFHRAGWAGRAREIAAWPARATATKNRRAATAIGRRRNAAPPIGARPLIGTDSCDLSLLHPIIAAVLEFLRERAIPRLQYPSAREHMDLVRHDVVEQ